MSQRVKARGPRTPSQGRGPVLRFLAIVVAGIVAFYLVTALPWFQDRFFPSYLNRTAQVTAQILNLIGEEAVADGPDVVTPDFSLRIMRGCDAIEPIAIFAVATLAFPVPFRRRVVGAAIGAVVLLVLNEVRIVSLYYTGVHIPGSFDMIHEEIWQPVFILATMALWITWAMWASRPARKPSDAPKS